MQGWRKEGSLRLGLCTEAILAWEILSDQASVTLGLVFILDFNPIFASKILKFTFASFVKKS